MSTIAQTGVGIVIAAALAVAAYFGTVSAGPLFANYASAGYGGDDHVQECLESNGILAVAGSARAYIPHGGSVNVCAFAGGGSAAAIVGSIAAQVGL